MTTFGTAVGTLLLNYGNTNISLNSGTMGYIPGGFGYKSDNEPLMWTTIDLISSQPDADFRYKIYTLDRLKKFANDYSSDVKKDTPVYFKWVTSGEPLRQTIVHDLTYEIVAESNLTAMLGKDAAKARVAIQHSPWWEGTAISYSNVGTVSDHGGTVVMGMPNVSDECRLSSFTIDDSALYTPSGQRNKIWVGIREENNGYTGFIPKWECEKGSLYTDASAGTILYATNGTAVNVTFSSATAMTKRFSVMWSNIATANYDDIIGSYLVLARTKLSGTAVEIAAELKYGWLGMSGLESSAGVQFLSGTQYSNWNYIPMGVVDIPPTGDRGSVSSSGTSPLIKQFGMSMFAERLGTAGSASWDCFVLIPTDHMMTINQAAIDHDTGKYLVAYTGDDETPYAINKMGFTGAGNVEYSFENWMQPMGNGVMVIVCQGSAASATAGHTIISYDVVNRYRSYTPTGANV